MNVRVVFKAVGLLVAFTGVTMLLPAAVSAVYGERAALALLSTAAFAALSGFALQRAAGDVEEISIRDGFAIVTLGWAAVCLYGTLPYLLSGSVDSFSRAYFETMSGFTTTGATIVPDIDRLPRGIVLWRSQTQWLGGMGIIVLSVAILPLLGVGGMQLLQAEIPGLAPDRLRPRVRQTAKLLWGVYALLTGAEIVLLLFGGMTPFEAVNHGFTTLATGGFSSENASLAAFSPYVQYVIALFMILAGINFTLHYSWMAGRWGAAWRNRELRVYLVILGLATAVLTLLLWGEGAHEGLEPGFRAALFQAASLMTTTGYVTENYELWPAAAVVLLVCLMLVGGCSGSTAGSIKVLRHMIVAGEGRTSLRRLLHPRGVFVYKVDGKPVSADVLASASGFLLLYLGSLVAGILLLALLGIDIRTAIGASAATIGNVGPGLGRVGPVAHYATLPEPALWVLTFLMLLGRLELYTVLVLFTRGYWRG